MAINNVFSKRVLNFIVVALVINRKPKHLRSTQRQEFNNLCLTYSILPASVN